MGDFAEFLRRMQWGISEAVTALKRIDDSGWLRGGYVTLTIAVGDTSSTGPHGLGRPHNGAVVVSASTATAISVAPAVDNRNVSISIPSALTDQFVARLWVLG